MATGKSVVKLPEPSGLDRFFLKWTPRYGKRRMQGVVRSYIWTRWGGGYDAGSSRPKEFQEWEPDVDSAISALHPALYDIRARARDVCRNNPLAAGAMDSACRSVIGTGLRVRPMIDHEFLDVDEEAADEWNKQARRCFELWATPEGGCDISMNRSFEELQSLVFRGLFEGGDVLVLDRFLSGRESPYSSCVQTIEAEQVSNPENDADSEELAGGVEVEMDTGIVRAYHVSSEHPGHMNQAPRWFRLPAYNEHGQRVARLVYRPHRIGERRGVPWLAAVLKSMKQLDRFTNAELQAAVVSSFFTAFIFSEGGGMEDDPLGMGIEGDPGPEGPTAIARQEDGDIRLGHGLVTNLGPGEKVEFADPRRPNDLYRPFVEMMWQHIGIGLGIPYEVFTMRFQESYSAAKGALAEAAKTFRVSKTLIQTHFCEPAYKRVIAESVARGLLDAPGFFDDPLKMRAWCRASWMGDAVVSLDPEREIKAARERIAAAVSNIDRESREITGSTFDENIAQRLKEAALMKEVRELEEPEPEPEPNRDGSGKDSTGGN